MRAVCVYDATRAEYDRFGGVGISMSGQSKSPAGPLLPEHPIHVLLLRANDLPIPAKLAQLAQLEVHFNDFP